jgi:hypothetical protein
MIKYKLTKEQVEQLQELNEANLIFVPTWDNECDCICVTENTFYLPEFTRHLELLHSWELEGFESEEHEGSLLI